MHRRCHRQHHFRMTKNLPILELNIGVSIHQESSHSLISEANNWKSTSLLGFKSMHLDLSSWGRASASSRVKRPTNMAPTWTCTPPLHEYRRRPTCSRSARTQKRWSALGQCRNTPVVPANQHVMGNPAREVRSQPLSWQRGIYYIAPQILAQPMCSSQAFLC